MRKTHHDYSDWLGLWWDLHPLLRLLLALSPAGAGVVRLLASEVFWPWAFGISLALMLVEGWRFARGKRSEDDYNF